jgi:hypothetical protein
MNYESIHIWGLLPSDGYEPRARSLIDQLVECLQFPETDAGEVYYPHGQRGSRKATTVAELAEAVLVSNEAQLGGVDSSVTVKYGDLEVVTRLYAPDEAISLTPAYHLRISASLFRDDIHPSEKVAARRQQLIDLATTVSVAGESVYSYVFPAISPRSLDEHPSREKIADGQIPELDWLTVFSETIVEQIGRDRFLSAPATEVRELEDGSIAIVANEDPLDRDVGRFRRVERHLRGETKET